VIHAIQSLELPHRFFSKALSRHGVNRLWHLAPEMLLSVRPSTEPHGLYCLALARITDDLGGYPDAADVNRQYGAIQMVQEKSVFHGVRVCHIVANGRARSRLTAYPCAP
jgi:hypothetical protein